MNAHLLIDNIVRQTTVLLAQLATHGGVRAPLAHIANQVFLELAKELECQGISKQVAADMFGLALRSYRRRVRRLTSSATDRDRSLWEAVLAHLHKSGMVTRREVLRRFFRDDEIQVRSVLHDLCESGLVFRLGSGSDMAYRAATPEELSALDGHTESVDELIWLVVYQQGPITRAALADAIGISGALLNESLARLQRDARVEEAQDGSLISANAVMPLGSGAGWEAAMFDHFQAVVATLCARLQAREEAGISEELGGSTYSFNVWPGHPYEEEVRSSLAQFRGKYTRLREQIQEYNAGHGLPREHMRVVVYGGQHITQREQESADEEL